MPVRFIKLKCKQIEIFYIYIDKILILALFIPSCFSLKKTLFESITEKKISFIKKDKICKIIFKEYFY